MEDGDGIGTAIAGTAYEAQPTLEVNEDSDSTRQVLETEPLIDNTNSSLTDNDKKNSSSDFIGFSDIEDKNESFGSVSDDQNYFKGFNLNEPSDQRSVPTTTTIISSILSGESAEDAVVQRREPTSTQTVKDLKSSDVTSLRVAESVNTLVSSGHDTVLMSNHVGKVSINRPLPLNYSCSESSSDSDSVDSDFKHHYSFGKSPLEAENKDITDKESNSPNKIADIIEKESNNANKIDDITEKDSNSANRIDYSDEGRNSQDIASGKDGNDNLPGVKDELLGSKKTPTIKSECLEERADLGKSQGSDETLEHDDVGGINKVDNSEKQSKTFVEHMEWSDERNIEGEQERNVEGEQERNVKGEEESENAARAEDPDTSEEREKSLLQPDDATAVTSSENDDNLEKQINQCDQQRIIVEPLKENVSSFETDVLEASQAEASGHLQENENLKNSEMNEPVSSDSKSVDNLVIKNPPDLKTCLKKEDKTVPKVKQAISEQSSKAESGECTKSTKGRNYRKKTDEKGSSASDFNNTTERYPILYKGFKSTSRMAEKSGIRVDKKSILRWNPFNPSWKKDLKSGKYSLHKSLRDDIDCSTLQPEYAQYLGLQPIVKFKCSNCGMSTFQSMSALNTHQIECKKNGKLITQTDTVAPPDTNAANIKLTRKVYLCSACGSYYKNCDLFLHMREYHRRYICLFCLNMASGPDGLEEHLRTKHNMSSQVFSSLDELQPSTFFLLCVWCDKVFTEEDDSFNHKCVRKHTSDEETMVFKKPRTDNLNMSTELANIQMADPSKFKPPPKCNKEFTTKQANSFPQTSGEMGNDVNDQNQYPIQSQSHVTENRMEAPEAPISTILNSQESELPDVPAEHLQMNIPCDIEIKPLIPGDNNQNNIENTQASGVDIFPIPIEPKTKRRRIIKRTVIKTIRKKKSTPLSKIKNIVNKIENSLPNEISEAEAPVSAEPAFELPKEDTLVTPQLPPEAEEPPVSLPPTPSPVNTLSEVKRNLPQDIFKMKFQGGMESDGESDDSQKLSLIVDENTNNSSDADLKRNDDMSVGDDTLTKVENSPEPENKPDSIEIALAGEEVAAMALTLDDKIENVHIQTVLKECVRTSCLTCNYCRHAVKIAVNGKQLSLHLLSEHRYTPVKNETNDDVINKLKSSLDVLKDIFLNAETYDSSDPSIHIPYDQDRNFDCFQCNYVSTSHKDLYAHKKKSHTKSLLLCIMCKCNFYSYSELICHICPGSYSAEIQFHNVDINFRCCFCRLDAIPSAFRLMVHLRKSHHTCDICLESCSDQAKLSTHMWKHKLNHLCYRCGIAYASKPDITKHLFWKHGTESVLCKKCLQKKWPHVYHFCVPPTSFICEECNTSFSKAVALKVHKRIHGNDFPYSCTQCEKKFVSKKLLNRHIERHNIISQAKDTNSAQDDGKEELINVTDVTDGKEDCSQHDLSDSNKEGDGRDKCHKKHKKEKEKEKKEKKVVDVYDLPPLNLSSESDSSDEEAKATKQSPKKETKETNGPIENRICPFDDLEDKSKIPDMTKFEGLDAIVSNPSLVLQDEKDSLKNGALVSTDLLMNKEQESLVEGLPLLQSSDPISPFDNISVQSLLALGKEETKIDSGDIPEDNQVEFGIWENFYKSNPQSTNSSLPYPLCAMKPDLALKIILGDHDYCRQNKADPVIKEDLPSTSNLESNILDDKLEEITPLPEPEKPHTPTPKEPESSSTPVSMTKKKIKSPKKKASKPDDNNSSSSSDSSSDSDSSTCTCGTNCSCSSSSSNSSSTSSSDSDSSTNDDKQKQEKRKKKKEKKSKLKPEGETEVVKEIQPAEPLPPPQPVDPPIRESELETDESTSDEEFYDRQPQRIANQMLAEKRQLMLLTSGAPVNNGDASPTIPPPQDPVPPEKVVESPKRIPKTKLKRRRKVATPRAPKHQKSVPSQESPYTKFSNETKPYNLFKHSAPTPQTKLKLSHSSSQHDATGSGSENDNARASKRRRVPNKFYGYSSGEEEDPSTPRQVPKWRKVESVMPPVTPKMLPSIPPPTPRIQLTVPKQIIRKPSFKIAPKPKIHSSSDSSDSDGSDIDSRVRHLPSQEPVKPEKDVYCYCRCPYDEVSEMIACDDEDCKIEWFHFECVNILVPPRGQWYCPGCRKARGLPT